MQKLCRACLRIWRSPLPFEYVPYQSQKLSAACGPYLVIDYVEESEGRMLPDTWDEYREHKRHMANLFRGLSSLMLRLSQTLLPMIGSFISDDRGFLILANKPLTSMLQESENAGMPTHIPRGRVNTSVLSYANDLLTYHDNRLLHEANAINDLANCAQQMSALTIIRAVMPRLYNRDLDIMPFAFSLTDLNQSNLFVDKSWNITHVIDLEWATSLPIEFIQLPHWLTNSEVDVVDVQAYDSLRTKFIDLLREDESALYSGGNSEDHPVQLSRLVERGWTTGLFWYNLALWRPMAMHSIFFNRIQP